MARPKWMTGVPVEDETRHRVTINITRADIVDAVALNGEKCVAGRATCRALAAHNVWFYRSKALVQWDEGTTIRRYQLSRPLIEKVVKVLDDPHRSNEEIEPGLYYLLPIAPGQRLGLDRSRRPGSPLRGPKPDRGHRIMGRITSTNTTWAGDTAKELPEEG